MIVISGEPNQFFEGFAHTLAQTCFRSFMAYRLECSIFSCVNAFMAGQGYKLNKLVLFADLFDVQQTGANRNTSPEVS